ncbi:conserved protein of unknown function [Limnospira indica PCC 8005]|uniref:Uncharacterized protein n=1 Tax=Limnospira indica PCC 8005 TaxID=376219 RepID=A0A9P1KGE1_9CYAN|nr:conserved protein of unknown function [Limnospira indica PCC 8005]
MGVLKIIQSTTAAACDYRADAQVVSYFLYYDCTIFLANQLR